MQQFQGFFKNEKGFTLIDLLVAMAGICILATLLIPGLSAAKNYSKSIGCKNHLHQMGIALQMYVHDNQNEFPRYLDSGDPSYGDQIGNESRALGLIYWSSKLIPYYPLHWTNIAFQCPGYTGKVSGPYYPGYIDRLGSYAYNTWGARIDDRTNEYLGLGPVSFWKDAQGNFLPAVSEDQVSVPSEMLAIGDSLMKVGMIGGDDLWHCGDLNALPYIFGHGKNYNQLLCDGHVSAMSPLILFNPSNIAPLWNYDHQPHPELWEQ